MNGENRDVAIEEFVRLKPKIYSLLLDSNIHKNPKAWIKTMLQPSVIMNIKVYY